jgi:hypothetical protein
MPQCCMRQASMHHESGKNEETMWEDISRETTWLVYTLTLLSLLAIMTSFPLMSEHTLHTACTCTQPM